MVASVSRAPRNEERRARSNGVPRTLYKNHQWLRQSVARARSYITKN
jgi:hypothetical protein